MISNWNTIFLLWLLLLCSLPGVPGLLDGGDFIEEVTEKEGVALGQDCQEEVCPVVSWLDVFVVASICPVVEDRKKEKADNEDKLVGMEELDTEHVGDVGGFDTEAKLLENTDPFPVTIRPLGLNVAPLIKVQSVEPAEEEKNL